MTFTTGRTIELYNHGNKCTKAKRSKDLTVVWYMTCQRVRKEYKKRKKNPSTKAGFVCHNNAPPHSAPKSAKSIQSDYM